MRTTKYLSRVVLALSLSIVMASVLVSCTERLDISTKDGAPHLVVYGYITTDTTQHYIRINRSTGYFATEKPAGISNAKVTISTDDATFVLNESKDEAGLYLTDANVYGLEGKTYTLNVSAAFDQNSDVEEYEASSYLPFRARLDSIQLKKSDILTDHIEVLFFGRMPENKIVDEINYMSFHVYGNEKLLNDSLVNFSVMDDEYLDNKEIVAAPCYFIDQDEDRYKIFAGDVISLRVDVFTKEYGEFIENAQKEVWGSIPIFSGPPANIQTNIKKKNSSNKLPISGFFSAYGGRWAHTIYKAK